MSIAVAACGDSQATEEEGGASTGSSMTTVKAIVVPAASNAHFYLGQKQGFFEERGIEIQLTKSFDGSAIVSTVVNGQQDVAGLSWSTLLTAASGGLPLVAIAPGDTAGSDPATDPLQIVALEGKGPSTIEDLAGKTLAINGLKGLSEISARASLQSHGVDDESVEYISIPFPEMGTALQEGHVDAAAIAEPFLTLLDDKQNLVRLTGPQVDTVENLPLGTTMASQEWVEEDPDLVRRFQEAMKDSLEYALSEPDALKAATAEFAEVKPGIADKMQLPHFTTDYNLEAAQVMADKGRELGIYDQKFDVSELAKPFPLPK